MGRGCIPWLTAYPCTQTAPISTQIYLQKQPLNHNWAVDSAHAQQGTLLGLPGPTLQAVTLSVTQRSCHVSRLTGSVFPNVFLSSLNAVDTASTCIHIGGPALSHPHMHNTLCIVLHY